MARIMLAVLRFFGLAPEIPSPPGMLDMEDFKYVTENEARASLTLSNLPRPIWMFSNPHNTNSMDGAYDVGHCPILTMNEKFIDGYLEEGSWVVWNIEGKSIFHQIVRVGIDDDGWFCKTAGLNLGFDDPYKIRREDITAICLGILFTKPSDIIIYK